MFQGSWLCLPQSGITGGLFVFYVGYGDLNSGPCASTASASPVQICLQLYFLNILWMHNIYIIILYFITTSLTVLQFDTYTVCIISSGQLKYPSPQILIIFICGNILCLSTYIDISHRLLEQLPYQEARAASSSLCTGVPSSSTQVHPFSLPFSASDSDCFALSS